MQSERLPGRGAAALLLILVILAVRAAVAAAADPPVPVASWQEASVLAALEDRSVAVRQEAIKWLSGRHTGSTAIGQALIAYVGRDRPQELRVAALRALGNMGSAASPFAAQIAPLVGDADETVVRAAGRALHNMGPAAIATVLPQLGTLLKSPIPVARDYAATLIGGAGAPGSAFVPQLLEVLRDPQVNVRSGALLGLGTLAPAEAVSAAPAVTALLRDPQEDVRFLATDVLCHMRPAAAPVVASATAQLKDPNPLVRAVMATGLSRLMCLGPEVAATAPRIVPLLKDSNATTRYSAADALGRMGPAAARFVPQLTALLTDPDALVRVATVQALDHLGHPPQLAPRVVQLLKDPNLSARIHAAEYLGHLGPAGSAVAPRIVAMLGDPTASTRDAAVNALGQLGPVAATAVPRLVGLLSDPDGLVRGDAAKALGRMGAAATPFVPQLLDMALNRNIGQLDTADSALAAMGPAAASAVPQLIARLEDPKSALSAIFILQKMAPVAGAAAPQLAALLARPEAASAAADGLSSLGPAALPFAPQLAALLKSSSPYPRREGMQALKTLKAAAPFSSQIAVLLTDSDKDNRAAAAELLGSLGPAASARTRQIAALLGDPDAKVREAALQALDNIAREGALQDRSILLACLEAADAVPFDPAPFLLRAYLYRKLTEQDLILIRWLGKRTVGDRPLVSEMDHEEVLAVLQTFNSTWDETNRAPGLRKDMAERIAELVGSQAWGLNAVPFLLALHAHLARGFPDQARTVQAVVDKNEEYARLVDSLGLVGSHIAAWALLLFAYPRSRWVQGFFFWNRWARRFLGLFYVGLLIRIVPWLRRRMLVPFRESLLPRRVLDPFNEGAYFPDCEVLLETGGRVAPQRLPLKEVLGSIRGQVVLKGPSGLGKTLLLLRLALASEEPVVFLRATECVGGVVAAIQKKLQGQLRDEHYLRTLIHAGGLKVLIDGLNEAPPDARSRITQFVEEYFKGDCILTTQPLSWQPPDTARVYVLQPLLPEQIEPFLLRQWAAVADRATLDEPQYQQAVARYLAALRQTVWTGPGRDPRLTALSNPMDATLAAELLARGEAPDMFRLIEQRYRVMAQAFRDEEGREFRLKAFAERVYEWRKSGQPDLPTEGFEAEVAALVKDRLMIQRTELTGNHKDEQEVSRWFFRHEKIMDFFLLPAFMDEHRDRRQQHAADEPFWGVYELLAARLSDDEEQQLHDFLVERAADTSSNDLLNRYTLAERFRPLRIAQASAA